MTHRKLGRPECIVLHNHHPSRVSYPKEIAPKWMLYRLVVKQEQNLS